MRNARLASPEVDATGLVRIDGVPIGRLTGRGTLEVKDTHGPRNRWRGTCYVEVDLQALVKADQDLANTA